ncbi:MAG: hypothetical protein R3C26_10585 [Calditrichia bacterium]
MGDDRDEKLVPENLQIQPAFQGDFAAARSGDAAIAPQLSEMVADSTKPAMVRATALELLQQFGNGEQLAQAIENGAIAVEPR